MMMKMVGVGIESHEVTIRRGNGKRREGESEKEWRGWHRYGVEGYVLSPIMMSDENMLL